MNMNKSKILVIGMGPINKENLNKIKKIKFDICYACGRCISLTKELNIKKTILCIGEGRIADDNFWIRAEKKTNNSYEYGRISNEIEFNLADECIIYFNKNGFKNIKTLTKASKSKMPRIKTYYKRYFSYFFASIKALGFFGFLYVLGLKGILLLFPSILANKQVKRWNYTGPSSGFKTIINALKNHKSITTIGFTINDRYFSQIGNKLIDYPTLSIKAHVSDDKKIYKVLKDRINFL